jgi:xanthine/CO dehydrogenase XdhC/CoxF family maturation factor
MRELPAILETWRGLDADGDPGAVLATVVHVTGSAYRRPGARMLMVPDGRRIGCVSGGCLEADIVRKAWWFTESGRPVVQIYDTTSEDDTDWEFGLGCNGVVHILLERVNTPAVSQMFAFLDARLAARKAAVAATVVLTDGSDGVRVGDKLLLDECHAPAGSLCGFAIQAQVLAHATAVLREKTSRLAHLGATDVFVEWIGPPLSMVVLGAGHDAIPLVNLARQLGWDVTVADPRPAYARKERFPAANRVVALSAVGDPLPEGLIDAETAVVVMTHNYPLDARLLPGILPIRPRYLGILGPKARAERLFSELALRRPDCVHAPAGLDLGSATPEAIALSIVAEIQAAITCRGGGELRRRREAIHEAAYEVGVSSAEQAAAGLRPDYCGTMLATGAVGSDA